MCFEDWALLDVELEMRRDGMLDDRFIARSRKADARQLVTQSDPVAIKAVECGGASAI